MTKRLLMIAVTLALSGWRGAGDQALASSGCCKERDAYDADWRKNGETLEACSQLNRRRDGDNVYERRGLVWWDVRCQDLRCR